MTVFEEEVPANSVPAAAVIRGGRVLLGMIRRKGSFKRFNKLKVFSYGPNLYVLLKLLDLSLSGDSRIHGVGVKSNNLMRNTSGEGDYLG